MYEIDMQAHNQTVTNGGAADRVACICSRQCLPNYASHNTGKHSCQIIPKQRKYR